MEIDFSQQLVNIYGFGMQEAVRKNPDEPPEIVPVTLKRVSVNALLADAGDKDIDGNDKLRRFQLANKIQKSVGPVKLTTDDVSYIKSWVGRVFPPLLAGQAMCLLEGEDPQIA